MSLRPCASCGRHVRATESACPFCATALEPLPTPPSSTRAVGRLGRAAIFAFGAVATTSAAACGGGTGMPDAASVVDTGGPAPLYGGAPDAAIDAAEATPDSGNVGPAYGTPPDDAGTDAAMLAMYGGPPPDDAAVDAAEPIGPLYGGPPLLDDAGTQPDAFGGIGPAYGTPGV